MATVFKQFLGNDIATTRTLLNEAIPITGSILSGTYGTFPNENNIKNFAHGMWQEVYDYPYLSSSANDIMSLTVGIAPSSAISSSTPVTQQEKKINIYNQMAQVLMGHDHTGSILLFDQDGDILAGGTKMRECIFINFARLLTKDEIKKGSFTMRVGTGTNYGVANNTLLTITDNGAQNDFKVNSPAGEYGILSASAGQAAGATSGQVGLLFYQAGIAIVTASVFMAQPVGQASADNQLDRYTGATIVGLLTGSNISSSCDMVRHRIYDISFNNTTELNSTIYFVRANHSEFNYSSNPTYLSSSKIVVKNNSQDAPVSYITGIGLYSSDGALLATAKVSEAVKKAPDTDITLRLRVDF